MALKTTKAFKYSFFYEQWHCKDIGSAYPHDTNALWEDVFKSALANCLACNRSVATLSLTIIYEGLVSTLALSDIKLISLCDMEVIYNKLDLTGASYVLRSCICPKLLCLTHNRNYWI